MTRYGPAFYGSDKIHDLLGRQLGEWKVQGSQIWLCGDTVAFRNPNTLYKLPIGHWFYSSHVFECAKKPSNEITRPLTDYSDDELQAEIERRKSQDDEITILARKVCADNTDAGHLRADFIEGRRDKTVDMRLAKAAVIAAWNYRKVDVNLIKEKL